MAFKFPGAFGRYALLVNRSGDNLVVLSLLLGISFNFSFNILSIGNVKFIANYSNHQITEKKKSNKAYKNAKQSPYNTIFFYLKKIDLGLRLHVA